MTPLEIRFLLHCYYSPEPFREGGQAFPSGWALESGLVQHPQETPDVYPLTDRGQALVNVWLATPLPVQAWVNPDTKKIVYIPKETP